MSRTLYVAASGNYVQGVSAGGPVCSGLPPGIVDSEGYSALSAGQHLAKGIKHPGLYGMSGIGLVAEAAQCVVKMHTVL